MALNNGREEEPARSAYLNQTLERDRATCAAFWKVFGSGNFTFYLSFWDLKPAPSAPRCALKTNGIQKKAYCKSYHPVLYCCYAKINDKALCKMGFKAKNTDQ
jgi:hypothetical protein